MESCYEPVLARTFLYISGCAGPYDPPASTSQLLGFKGICHLPQGASHLDMEMSPSPILVTPLWVVQGPCLISGRSCPD